MVARGGVPQTCERLAGEGCVGPYGFYEAIDYTPARLPRGQTQRRPCASSWRTTRA